MNINQQNCLNSLNKVNYTKVREIVKRIFAPFA